MTMTPQQELIRNFMTVFGEPRTADPKLFLALFEKAIGGWDAETLSQAGDQIMKTCTFWPKPAEVNAAAEQIVASRYKPEPYPVPGDLEKPDPVVAARIKAMVADATRAIQERSADMMVGTPPDWKRAQAPSFDQIQRSSANKHLHGGLTETSKRMTGERE